MSPVVVHHAEQHAAILLVAPVDGQNAPLVRCTQLSALSAEPRRRSRSYPRTTDLSIAVPATIRFALPGTNNAALLEQSI